MHRYISRVLTLQTAERSIEFWIGYESPEPVDVTKWDSLIPADGMTDEELAVVRTWIPI
jgi:hypothetical protein